MKKKALAVTLLFVLLVATVSAVGGYSFSWKGQDNGAGGIWAELNMTSSLSLAQTGDNNCYSYSRSDSGSFITYGGGSPGGTGTADSDITGSVTGGLSGIICGELLSSPDLSFRDLVGAGGSYADRYFGHIFSSISSFSISDWGWTYTSCGNGTWVNSASTDSGDVVGEAVLCAVDEEESVEEVFEQVAHRSDIILVDPDGLLPISYPRELLTEGGTFWDQTEIWYNDVFDVVGWTIFGKAEDGDGFIGGYAWLYATNGDMISVQLVGLDPNVAQVIGYYPGGYTPIGE